MENFKTYTLVEVLGRPLSGTGKPDAGSRSKGRFWQNYPAFWIPRVSEGRLLSVTGTLSANIRKPIGKISLRLPGDRSGSPLPVAGKKSHITPYPIIGIHFPPPGILMGTGTLLVVIYPHQSV